MPLARWDEGQEAPDFALVDTHGNTVRLSDFRGKAAVLLALGRGLF